MILKTDQNTILFVDLAMFFNPDYKTTLLNVYEMEYTSSKVPIDIIIKTNDDKVKLNKRLLEGEETEDDGKITPADLSHFLDMVQAKYNNEIGGSINTDKGVELKPSTEVDIARSLEDKEIDKKILMNQLENKINELELKAE